MRRVRTKFLSNGAAVVTWAVKATPVLDATDSETESEGWCRGKRAR